MGSSRKLILIATSVIVITGVGLFTWGIQKDNQNFKQQTVTPTQEPQKIEFGTKIPTDFPTDIPVEQGVTVEQSYSLNYVGQKQLTIVFPSSKTVEENYALYADFLKNKNWNISNKYESMKVSSLYGTKESNDINVTISDNTSNPSVKSQVSISVLKK